MGPWRCTTNAHKYAAMAVLTTNWTEIMCVAVARCTTQQLIFVVATNCGKKSSVCNEEIGIADVYTCPRLTTHTRPDVISAALGTNRQHTLVKSFGKILRIFCKLVMKITVIPKHNVNKKNAISNVMIFKCNDCGIMQLGYIRCSSMKFTGRAKNRKIITLTSVGFEPPTTDWITSSDLVAQWLER